MHRFACDYQEGCLPAILERLAQTNLVQAPGYGEDEFSERARQRIRAACGAPDARVFFFCGGTQTNSVTIHGMLRSFEGVISADTGHVCGHEAGAVEARGHKVLTIPGKDGKISADGIRRYMKAVLEDDSCAHVVQPGMVYISQPTELGTLYSLKELQAISAVCREYALPLFVDGARLAYGLAAEDNDVGLKDLAQYCDAFYLGGTKCGGLIGEALVLTNDKLCPKFFTTMKQQGAVLAKGRLVGITFEVLMEDDNYRKAGRHGVELAQKLKAALVAKGYKLAVDTPTNQIFVIMDDAARERLAKDFVFSNWCRYDDEHWIVRFCTSWATDPAAVEALIAAL